MGYTAQATGTAQLSGYFKEVYGSEPIKVASEVNKLQMLIPFATDEKLGNKFHVPVRLTRSAGVSYALAGAGAFTLNGAVSMTSADAQVQSSQVVIQDILDYESAAKGASDKQAFKKTTQVLIENMQEAGDYRLELALLYGQCGLGQTNGSANSNSTTTVVQVATGTWATGIWAGSENAKIVFHKNSDNTLASSGDNAIFTVSSVDVDNKKLTVTGSTTGISALDTALGAATHDIYFYGTTSGSAGTFASNEMAGLHKILSNSGTLFNISASTYGLWKSNSVSAGSAALTMSKLLSAVGKGVQKGLSEKVLVVVNPDTWANIASDLAAQRKFDGSYKSSVAENGFETIKFYGQNGEIEIMSHNCCKEGYAYVLPIKRIKRIGSTDWTFKTPGRGDEIFLQVAAQAGYELRMFTDQCVFCEVPGRATLISSITNS